MASVDPDPPHIMWRRCKFGAFTFGSPPDSCTWNVEPMGLLFEPFEKKVNGGSNNQSATEELNKI